MLKNLSAINALMRKHWRYLFQIGTWIMALLASFVLPPPLWDFKQQSIWVRFAHFVLSALVGLMFIPMSVWSSKRHRKGWAAFTVATLVAGGALFFGYQALRDNWTAAYAGKRIIIGETYTNEALEYRAKVYTEEKRTIPDDELIMDSAGQTDTIWQVSELRRRAFVLAGVYVGTVTFFALSVVSLAQALYCNSRRT